MDATQVDTADGEKIVGHVFGGQQDQVAAQLAGTANLGGIGGDLIRKALPILAPIVMSYFAKKIFGQGGQGAGEAGQAGGVGGGQAGGIDLCSILGGILGTGARAGAGAGTGGGASPGSALSSLRRPSRLISPAANRHRRNLTRTAGWAACSVACSVRSKARSGRRAGPDAV